MEQCDVIVIGAGIAGLAAAAYLARTDPEPQMAGHWAFSPRGSPVAVLTGKLAVNSILSTREEV
ncbi:MAG: NAD(P)-binding protein [Caldiserica bacterium]|nr:NAD(P)-binding protein [Caldisericota bacterium]